MSDRLTAEPGTLEFLRQLLEIAQESDHPMDKALTKALSKQIGKTEAKVLSKQKGEGKVPHWVWDGVTMDKAPTWIWDGVTLDAETGEWIPSRHNKGGYYGT